MPSDSKKTKNSNEEKLNDYKMKRLAQLLSSSSSSGMTRYYMAFSSDSK